MICNNFRDMTVGEAEEIRLALLHKEKVEHQELTEEEDRQYWEAIRVLKEHYDKHHKLKHGEALQLFSKHVWKGGSKSWIDFVDNLYYQRRIGIYQARAWTGRVHLDNYRITRRGTPFRGLQVTIFCGI